MRDGELTRNKILHTSGALFNTLGYKATSLRDITEATGLTKGAIYRHFESKEELENQTLLYLSTQLSEKLRSVIKAQPTAGAKLRAVFAFFKSYVTNPPIAGGCPLLNAAVECDDTNPPLRKGALKILDALTMSVVHILEKGKEYKQIRIDTDSAQYATIIIAALEGAIMMSKLRGNNQDIRMVIRYLDGLVANIEE